MCSAELSRDEMRSFLLEEQRLVQEKQLMRACMLSGAFIMASDGNGMLQVHQIHRYEVLGEPSTPGPALLPHSSFYAHGFVY